MKHKKIDFGLLSLKPNSSQENSGLTAKLIQTMAWFTPRQAPEIGFWHDMQLLLKNFEQITYLDMFIS